MTIVGLGIIYTNKYSADATPDIWVLAKWVEICEAMDIRAVSDAKPLVGLLAVLVAWWYQIRISARLATIDLLGNGEWMKGREDFAEATKGWTIPFPHEPENYRHLPRSIVTYLNHCELVAVAIKKGVVNKQMYKLSNRTQYVTTWELASEYIKAERNKPDHRTAYENFEHLALQWGAKPISPSNERARRP